MNVPLRMRARPYFTAVAVGFLLTALAAALQWASGAYSSELLGYPDEPSHYVTSLMVHDYIRQGFPVSPVQFAKDFYLHYPAVGIGHWPPLLYLVQASWMLLFTPSRVSGLVCAACLTGGLALLVYFAARRRFGFVPALVLGIALPLLPVVQTFSCTIMADVLLTLLCFAAALAYARFLTSGRWQDSAWFGLLMSLAVLTKGSGWLLALVPPLAMVLTRRLGPLCTLPFCAGPAIVFVLCVPWQLATMHMVAQGWNGDSSGAPALARSVIELCVLLSTHTTGAAVFVFVPIGAAVTLAAPFPSREVSPDWAVMGSLIVATIMFHAAVPAGVEARKIIIAAPAVLLFAAAGIAWMARRLRWAPQALAGLCAVLFGFGTFTIPVKAYSGYQEAARVVAGDPRFANSAVLLSSESHEGSFVAEMAMREIRPGHIILRATKVLAKTDWNGSQYEAYYHTPEAMLSYLDRIAVNVLVLEHSPPHWNFEHHRVLREMVAKYPGEFRLVRSIERHTPEESGEIRIYERPLPLSRSPGALRIDLTGMLREVLEK